MRKSKFTESRIIKAIKANENGQRVEDLCRELGIRPATFYGWRKKYSGMEVYSHAHTTSVRDTSWPERGVEHGLYE